MSALRHERCRLFAHTFIRSTAQPNQAIATTMEIPPTSTSTGGRPNATSERIPSGINMPERDSHDIAFAEPGSIGSRSSR